MLENIHVSKFHGKILSHKWIMFKNILHKVLQDHV